MIPGMVFAVLSRDPDFVQDVAVLLRDAGAEVFAAGSWEEYASASGGRSSCGDGRGGSRCSGWSESRWRSVSQFCKRLNTSP